MAEPAVPVSSTDSTAVNIGALSDLLKHKLGLATEMVSCYLKAFTVFVAITGRLLKFALDAQSTPALRRGLSLFGVLVSVMGLVACHFGERFHQSLNDDIGAIAKTLGVGPASSSARPLHYIVIIALAFAVSVALGWLYLLIF
jgi:hypothetical protein